jgi:hypothetical protein
MPTLGKRGTRQFQVSDCTWGDMDWRTETWFAAPLQITVGELTCTARGGIRLPRPLAIKKF